MHSCECLKNVILLSLCIFAAMKIFVSIENLESMSNILLGVTRMPQAKTLNSWT